ncbi:hypothetical protein AHiyo4_11230 [Arthrobacter sp. Hiyo4]|nr:hypothetical protein AHiyo4_11230 [Arthrobacter sp. Hiyo4]
MVIIRQFPDVGVSLVPVLGLAIQWPVPRTVWLLSKVLRRARAAYPESMKAGVSSVRTLTGRVKAVYENLPLPPAVVAAMALDLLLARLRPLPLPASVPSTSWWGQDW